MILKSKKISDYIRRACMKQNRYDLQEELLYYCISELLEKNPIDFKSYSEVERYFIGIVMNQMNSDTSKFYRLYRNNGFTKSVSNVIDICDIDIEEIELDKDKLVQIDKELQVKLDIINKTLLACNPFNVDIFKMRYLDDMSFEDISNYYGIKKDSVKYRVKRVRNELKKILKDGNNN